MDLSEQSPHIRRATPSDKDTLLNILTQSFRNDPHLQWLTAPARHKRKLEITQSYLIDEALNAGWVYLTNNEKGAALWLSEQKESLSWSMLWRNISFLLKMGIPCVIRNLKSRAHTEKKFPKNVPYYYLYSLGVLPEAQGQSLASDLLNPVLSYCTRQTIPVFLETATQKNVQLYRNKGFRVTGSWKADDGNAIFYMKY